MATLLTFAYLRELQKKERDSRKLEKLPANFYAALAEYVARKESNADSTLMEKKEFESAVPVIKYILDRREQKVLEIAMMSIRVDGVKPENFLPEEEAIFNEVRAVLKKHEDAVGRIFARQKAEGKGEEKEKSGEKKDAPASDNAITPAALAEKKPDAPERSSLKILKEVPSFIAEDMLVHGPWKEGEVAECPPKAAKILVKNGFAEYCSK